MVLHLAPLQSWAGHGQEGNQWLKPRLVEMGLMGAHTGLLRQWWEQGGFPGSWDLNVAYKMLVAFNLPGWQLPRLGQCRTTGTGW